VVRRASGLRSPLPAVPAYGAPRRACRPPLPTRPSPGSRALAAAAGDGGGDGRQVNHQIQLRWKLNWQVARLGALQNLDDVGGRAAVRVEQGPPSRERLFDHLVGAGEERGRDGEAERLRRLDTLRP
jgi:hypothetical protein